MKIAKIALLSLSLTSTHAFAADIYKCVDDAGQPAFADGKTKAAYKNCKALLIGDPSPPSTPSSENRIRTPTPANFPKVDKQTQASRDNKRRDILQDELSSEQKALADIRKTYQEQKSNAELFKANNLKEPYKITQYEDNLQRLQNEMNTHEKNIQLLQKELDSIK